MSQQDEPDWDDWSSITLHGLAQAVHESEVSEIVWQTLIGAYVDTDNWRTVAEAVFRKHGYEPEEIIRDNA